MAAGEHETVAVGPGGIGRVVPEEPRPEHVGGGCQGHRRAGMPRLGRLDGIHGQHPDRVDAAPGQFGIDDVGVADGGTAGRNGPGVGGVSGQTSSFGSRARPGNGRAENNRQAGPGAALTFPP